MKDVGTKFTGEYEKTGHAEVTDDDLALLDEADKINSVVIHPHTRPDRTLPMVPATLGAKRNVGTASSGNYGHEGRPGERGGSAPSGGAQGTSVGKTTESKPNVPAWRIKDLESVSTFVSISGADVSPKRGAAIAERYARNIGGLGKAVRFENVDDIAATLSNNKYAIISGGRNGSAESGERDMDANDPVFHERSAELRAELERGGYSYSHGVGNYDGKEDSFLVMVHDNDEREILKMGVKYNQQSVIVSEGGVAKQVYTHAATDNDGTHHAKGSYYVAESYHDVDDKADNYYTELPFDGPGKFTRFSLDIDFANEKQGYQMNTDGAFRNMGTAASGNWGHEGRPGERGGSIGKGGASASSGKGPAGDVTLDSHDTSKLSYMQEKTLCDGIRAEMPSKELWKNPRGYEIADMALAGFGGRGSTLVVARGEQGEFEGLAKYFTWSPPFAPDDKKIKIQFIASVGDIKHVGTDMLSKIIEKNTGRAVELEADSDARTFYQHIGMHNDWGDGMTFHWSAEEAAAFADLPRAHVNIGGPGSGHFSHESEKGKGPGGSISSKGEGPVGGRKLDPKKVANGKKTHVPQDPVKLAHATANEQLIADQIPRSIHTPDHEPFDVLSKPYAIEVKTICPGAKNPKITMHNDDERQSLSRKWAEAEKNNLDPWTVAIDARAGYDKPVYYIKHGLGSFNLSAMTKTTLAEIKGVFA